MSGGDLLHFSYSSENNLDLAKPQIQEDLSCLKILFESVYAAEELYPALSLTDRLEKLSEQAFPMKSTQLADLIFELHRGLPDLHLSYQINGLNKRFAGENKREVAISENLETEKIYDRANYVYFKPAKLLTPLLSEAQNSFLEFVKDHDRNLVLDLREVKGGGGNFPIELAQNIFTFSQKIPQSKTYQLNSGLSMIGLAVTSFILYQDQAKGFFDSIMNSLKDKKFSQLLNSRVDERSTDRAGQRLSPYRSKIILLIDGRCASHCETIVELLSAHPNATLVGQNTLGALHFSNAASFILPNSRIWAQVPSLSHILENDAVEGVGYEPAVRSEFIDLEKLGAEIDLVPLLQTIR